MTKLEDAVRDTIEELAFEAKGADLGQRALSGARRRSVVVLGARVVAALVVVAMAVGLAVFIDGRRIDVPPAGSVVWPLPKPLDTKSTGSVLTHYHDNSGSKILDPKTGKYRDISGRVIDFSPDLRYVVVAFEQTSANDYEIFDTTTGKKVYVVAEVSKNTIVDVAWSPDGRRLAILEEVSYLKDNGDLERQSFQLNFLDLRTGESKAGELPDVPRITMVGWLSDSSAVVTMNATREAGEHYLIRRDGSHSAAMPWRAGFIPGYKMVPRTNLMVLTKYSEDRHTAVAEIVMDVRTGKIVDERVSMNPPADTQMLMEWLTVNERLMWTAEGVAKFNVRTGAIKHVRDLNARYGIAARPASGLSPAAQRLVF